MLPFLFLPASRAQVVQELIRFWIADHRSSMAAASGGEISYAVLVGAEATLNGTAAELPAGTAVKPPSAVIAAARIDEGGRILVVEFRVAQVSCCCALAHLKNVVPLTI
jgi:hypothetical protein